MALPQTSTTQQVSATAQTSQEFNPTWRIEMALGGIYFSRSWVDVTTLVRRFSFTRGRADELQDFSTLSLDIIFDNQDGFFTPEYSPLVSPGRPMRVFCEAPSRRYLLCFGYVDEWSIEYPAQGKDAIAQASCNGVFTLLQSVRSDTFLDPQITSDRIIQMVSEAGAIELEIPEPGTIAMPEFELYETEIGSVVKSAASTEFGQLFENKSGGIRFEGRGARFAQTETRIVFGDELSVETGYEDASWDYSQNKIFNRVTITADPDDPQTVLDLGSASKYGVRQFSADIDAINSVDDDAFNVTYAESLASFIVGRYSEPALRVENIGLYPAGDEDVWDALLALDINDRVVVNRRPPAYVPELTTSTTRTTRFGLPNLGGDDVLFDLSAENSSFRGPLDEASSWVIGARDITNFSASRGGVFAIAGPDEATDGSNYFQFRYTPNGTEVTSNTVAGDLLAFHDVLIPLSEVLPGSSFGIGDDIFFWVELDSLGGTMTIPSGNNSATFIIEPFLKFYATDYSELVQPGAIGVASPVETVPTTTVSIPKGRIAKRVSYPAGTDYFLTGKDLGYVKVGVRIGFTFDYTFVANALVDVRFDNIRVYGGLRETQYQTINGTASILLNSFLGQISSGGIITVYDDEFAGWVDTREPSIGTRIERECFVEQIRYDVAPGNDNWKVSLGLSDAITGAYWALGKSKLGIDTRLAI